MNLLGGRKTRGAGAVKRKGKIWDYSPTALVITLIAITILGLIAADYFKGVSDGAKVMTLRTEVVNFNDDALNFYVNYAKKGAGFVYKKDDVPLNAENFKGTKSGFKSVGTGASAYFCSKTIYGCKVKYRFSTGVNNETWSIFTDASKAFSGKSRDEIIEIEELLINEFPSTAVVDHSATTVSAASTDVPASSSNDGDGIFEIGQL